MSPHWKWDNSVDVRRKKCKGCGQSMYLDVASAVLYKDENWHLHCLMDMLTEYHVNGLKSDQQELIKEWGNAP